MMGITLEDFMSEMAEAQEWDGYTPMSLEMSLVAGRRVEFLPFEADKHSPNPTLVVLQGSERAENLSPEQLNGGRAMTPGDAVTFAAYLLRWAAQASVDAAPESGR